MVEEKNKLSLLEAYRRLRKVWTVNPQTKVVPNGKKKKRAKLKREFLRESDSWKEG